MRKLFAIILGFIFPLSLISQIQCGETRSFKYITKGSQEYFLVEKNGREKAEDSLIKFLGFLLEKRYFQPDDVLNGAQPDTRSYEDSSGARVYGWLGLKKPNSCVRVDYIAWLTSQNSGSTDSLAFEIKAKGDLYQGPCFYTLILRTRDKQKKSWQYILEHASEIIFRKGDCEI